MKDKVNQYIIREYEKLKSKAEKREFLEKIRFLMMTGDKDFVISVIPSHRLKIYAASTAKGKEVPQIVL